MVALDLTDSELLTLEQILKMALMLYRFPLEYFLSNDLDVRSKALAREIFFDLAHGQPAQSSELTLAAIKHTMSNIETWPKSAYSLRVAVELSVKQYHIVSFPASTTFDADWMTAEKPDGSLVDKSDLMQAPRKVLSLLFPALAQLPEDDLQELTCPDDWERVMPTSKRYLDDEGVYRDNWLCCCKAVVVLERGCRVMEAVVRSGDDS
jgi:hypothetical protein